MSSEVITRNDLKNVLNELILFFYPVGSYYETSDTDFDPNTDWGGNWELEVQGQVHVSGDDGEYQIHGASLNVSDGGAAAVVLGTSHLPAHTHGSKSLSGSVSIFKGNQTTTASGILSFPAKTNRQYKEDGTTENSWQTMTVTATHEHNSVGGTGSHGNMQPYIVVNRWHRLPDIT
jgi:microcystin-dependent protein